MDKSIITFSANEQALIKTGGIGCYASDTVSYVEAQFTLGDNWSGYDSIRAVWFNDYQTISTVLNPNGVCIVPHEVLVNRGKVSVNLVGSILVSGELSDRLTTFPCEALKVSAKAKINGSETTPITPSQFEQYVAQVTSLVASVTDIGVPVGGTTGQVLAKASDSDYDTEWVNQSGGGGGGGTSDYTDLTNKPKINNVELNGNKSTSDLGLFSGSYNDLTNKPALFSGNYTDLTNKPKINNVELNGNKSLADLGIVIPTVPVTSVNGQIGTVVLDADDVGALPDDTVIPTKTSDLQNDSGFITNTVTTVTVSGTDPVITAEDNHRYICGEVLTLGFTPCAEGICDVLFTSGTTPTVLTLPQTVKFPDTLTIEASKTYEINIVDGVYGVVVAWA